MKLFETNNTVGEHEGFRIQIAHQVSVYFSQTVWAHKVP